MHVLILTRNTGGGHNACARGMQQTFLEQGDTCDIADALAFISKKLSKWMSQGHTTMYRRTPGLCKVGYDFAEKHPSLPHDEARLNEKRGALGNALPCQNAAAQMRQILCEESAV